jgi:hypothetical protein
MRLSWSVPVLIVLAALAGYASGTRPLQAQSEQWPFSTGEVITLTFPGGGTRPCSIEEIKGMFARCGTGQRQPLIIGQRERSEEWVNLAQVEWITKRHTDR